MIKTTVYASAITPVLISSGSVHDPAGQSLIIQAAADVYTGGTSDECATSTFVTKSGTERAYELDHDEDLWAKSGGAFVVQEQGV